jgi:hypothetical protein
MNKPRKQFGELTPSYRKRLKSYGRANGFTDRQVRERYNRGMLDLKTARGHASTPERPEQADQQPGKFRDYVRRHGKTMRVLVEQDNGGIVVEMVPNLTKREQSTVGSHWNAVNAYLRDQPGAEVWLAKFEGKRVNGRLLATSFDDLDDFAMFHPDELDFEDIYEEAAP